MFPLSKKTFSHKEGKHLYIFFLLLKISQIFWCQFDICMKYDIKMKVLELR